MVVLWSVVNGCPLWINVLPENDQHLSNKGHGELGHRKRSMALPDVTTVRQSLVPGYHMSVESEGEKVAQKALQVPGARDFH